MKKLKEIELLSAYIDGELNPEERAIIEQKLKLSPDLRKRYEEMLKVKQLTSESVGKLKENPFLDTRIMAAVNEGKSFTEKLRKFVPAIGIAVVTIILMTVLKFNPSLIDEIVEQQKSNIAGFYQQNLKSLLSLNELTREELFNFAFYQELPIDKDNNRFLKLGYEENGTEFFEIKNAGISQPVNNLEKFVTALNLNDTQRKQVDSILDTYTEDIQLQVLVNDQNTLAISPKIWQLRKAMAADIYTFASNVGGEVMQQYLPDAVELNPLIVAKAAKELRGSSPKEYIFVTPDSIFHDDLIVDISTIKDDMRKMKIELNEDRLRIVKGEKFKEKGEGAKDYFAYGFSIDSSIMKLHTDAAKEQRYKVLVNGNNYKVELNEVDFPKVEMPDFDKISLEVEKATQHLKNFTVNVQVGGRNSISQALPQVTSGSRGERGSRGYNYNYRINDSSFQVQVNIPNIDSILKVQKIVVDSLNRLNKLFESMGNEDFMFKVDSVASSYKLFMGRDSVLIFDGKEFKEEMHRMQRELREFRLEMNELQRSKPDSVKTTKKRVIEI